MMPTDPLDVPPGSLTLEAITDLLEGGGSAPAGAAGDIQFSNGDGAFADAAQIASGCEANMDASGNLNVASASGSMDFTAAGGSVAFIANDLYTAGASKVQFNAGGDTVLVLDSSVNPETITLDSDLSNTEIFIGKSTGLVIKVGGPSASIGFFNATPITKPTVTGSKGGNVALASLLTQLAALGLVTDSTT